MITLEIAINSLFSEDYDTQASKLHFYSLRDSSFAGKTYEVLEPILLDFPNHKNHRVAMAIKWLDDHRAIKPLIALLSDNETKGFRSTLIYAIAEFNPIGYVELFTDMLIEGRYDISRECANVIDNLEGDIEEETHRRCITKLSKALSVLKEGQPEVCEFDAQNQHDILLYILSLFDPDIECDLNSSVYDYDKTLVERINQKRR